METTKLADGAAEGAQRAAEKPMMPKGMRGGAAIANRQGSTDIPQPSKQRHRKRRQRPG